MNSGHGLSDSQSTDRLTMSTPSASAAHSTMLVITIPLIQKFSYCVSEFKDSFYAITLFYGCAG
jgi:hypothetical protein